MTQKLSVFLGINCGMVHSAGHRGGSTVTGFVLFPSWTKRVGVTCALYCLTTGAGVHSLSAQIRYGAQFIHRFMHCPLLPPCLYRGEVKGACSRINSHWGELETVSFAGCWVWRAVGQFAFNCDCWIIIFLFLRLCSRPLSLRLKKVKGGHFSPTPYLLCGRSRPGAR